MAFQRKSPPGSAPRSARLTVGAVALALAAVAVLLLAGSFASYEDVKERLDRFASDGDAGLARDDFAALVFRLRLAAVVAVALAGAVFAARGRLAAVLAALTGSTAASAAALARATRRGVAHETPLHLTTLGLLTAIGLGLRLAFLFQPMRYDEAVTYVHYASQPWYIAASAYTAPNNHVLHSLLVHVSTLALGGEPWAIRLPALLAGVALVPATYVAARALYGRRAALLAAAFAASSSTLVEYSTNARGYTLVALLFMLLIALSTRIVAGGKPGEWVAFAALGAIGLWTVPVFAYGLGGVTLWLAVSFPGPRRSRLRLLGRRLVPALAASIALTALLYVPVLAAAGGRALFANEFVEPRNWGVVVDELPHSLAATARAWNRDLSLPVAVVLAAAFAIAVVFHRRVSGWAVAPALALAAFAAPIVVLQRVAPFERVWLFALPLYLSTASAGLLLGLDQLGRARRPGERAVPAVALAACAVLAGVALATRSVETSEDTSPFRPGAAVAGLLQRELGPADRALAAPPADAVLEYWLRRRGLDPAVILYWAQPNPSGRLLVVVKEGPKDYRLARVLGDPRLDGIRFDPPRVVRRFDGATVYELRPLAPAAATTTAQSATGTRGISIRG